MPPLKHHRAWFLFCPIFACLQAAEPTVVREGTQSVTTNEVFSMAVAPWSAEHPRNDHAQIFPLKDGSLLLAWSEYYVRRPSHIFRNAYSKIGAAGDETPCQLTGKVSKDGGRTWSGRLTLQENIGADNVKQPGLLRCANGDVLFFFTQWDFKKHERSIQYKRSTDDCETWSSVRQLSKPGGAYILDAGRVFLHSSGRIILPNNWTPEIWTANESLRAFCHYSDDNGETWSVSKNQMHMPQRGAMEPTMIERKDGSIYVILRSGVGYLFDAVSTDRGETWSEPKPTLLTSPQAEPCLRRIPSTGDLLLMWCNALPYGMSDPASKSFHRPRNPLSCAISRDDGKTWENIKNIENREGYDSAYPNVCFNGKEALITYYQMSASASRDTELMLKIFPIEWFYRAPANPRI